MNPLDLMQFKRLWDEFTGRHPKFPLFLNAVAQNGITEGTIIEVQIKRPDGKEFSSNLKLSKEDMELFQKMKDMR
ncbi:MAG: hypothetical protein IJZ53_04735 [Tyzzerella sp.]|nr:hypothetical protein [Tyzzerella sp.]